MSTYIICYMYVYLLSAQRTSTMCPLPFQLPSTILPEDAKHETGFHSDTSGKIYLRSLWKLILTKILHFYETEEPVEEEDGAKK